MSLDIVDDTFDKGDDVERTLFLGSMETSRKLQALLDNGLYLIDIRREFLAQRFGVDLIQPELYASQRRPKIVPHRLKHVVPLVQIVADALSHFVERLGGLPDLYAPFLFQRVGCFRIASECFSRLNELVQGFRRSAYQEHRRERNGQRSYEDERTLPTKQAEIRQDHGLREFKPVVVVYLNQYLKQREKILAVFRFRRFERCAVENAGSYVRSGRTRSPYARRYGVPHLKRLVVILRLPIRPFVQDSGSKGFIGYDS